ncbi:hypothetical protein ACFE04_009871 [Oxalis oulophora]
MAVVQDQLEIKFRLTDGTDIGPKTFPATITIAALKDTIIAQWPKDKDNAPKTLKDVKLISGGRVLENNRTVGECRSSLCDAPEGWRPNFASSSIIIFFTLPSNFPW